MLNLILSTVLARKMSSFLNNIRLDATSNTLIQQLNFWMFSYMSNVILVVLHEPYDSCFAFSFEVLHEPYDSLLAFLLEVSIKQSQIWDTLPTSKMNLFVIKRICKVISCRVMILYTQYCPMSFFICLSLEVSFCSRWFHLKHLRWWSLWQ